MLWHAIVTDEQFVLCVNGITTICKRELEQLCFSNRFGGACFNTHVAMDATQVVDFVHETETFTWRSGVVRIVVLAAHVNALRRTHASTQFATDALFHAVFVTVQNMTAVKTLWLLNLFVFVVAILATENSTT